MNNKIKITYSKSYNNNKIYKEIKRKEKKKSKLNYDATSFPIIKDAEWIQMIIVLCEQNPEIKTIKITKTENINKGIQGNVQQ